MVQIKISEVVDRKAKLMQRVMVLVEVMRRRDGVRRWKEKEGGASRVGEMGRGSKAFIHTYCHCRRYSL